MNTTTISVQLTQQEFDLVAESIDLHLGAAKKYVQLNSQKPEVPSAFKSILPGFDAPFGDSNTERTRKERKAAEELTLLSAKLIEAKRASEANENSDQSNQQNGRS